MRKLIALVILFAASPLYAAPATWLSCSDGSWSSTTPQGTDCAQVIRPGLPSARLKTTEADKATYYRSTQKFCIGGSGGMPLTSYGGLVVTGVAPTYSPTDPVMEVRTTVAMVITDAWAYDITLGGGSSIIIDVKKNGNTIFGTNKITINAGVNTSLASSPQPDLVTTSLPSNSLVQFFVTQAGTTAASLYTVICGYQP